MNMKTLHLLVVLCLASCSGLARQETEQAPSLLAPGSPIAQMPAQIEEFEADQALLERSYRVPFSSRRHDRMASFYEEWETRLAGLDFGGMSRDDRIDCLLLKNVLRHERSVLDRHSKTEATARGLVPFSAIIVELEEKRRTLEPVASEPAAARLVELLHELKDIRKTAEGVTDRAVARRAAEWTDQLRSTLRDWHGFSSGYDPVFAWWVERPWKDADRELEAYGKFLHEKSGEGKEGAEGLVGAPIGREGLLAELAFEMIPYTPEELLALAQREFAWCEARMKEVTREMGCGEEWTKALELVKARHVAPGKQPELIRDLVREAVAFLDQRDLVTIPKVCREGWRMEMMSPERQKTTPYFTGGEVISVSYPTAEMSNDQKLMSMRGNNVSFAHATVHHEVIPGHHLQLFMSERHRPYRRLFRTPFLLEGWPLYWEMLLWDLGFGRNPEEKVGMLFWRVHRCARIIVSIGFHLGTMQPTEMVDFLVKRVGHEPDGATAEVRRYVSGDYGPLYQAAYMLGGLQLRALYRELVTSGKMTPREFHDAVLQENAIPVELIRASLTHQELEADFSSRWRFAD
jgi:hypothetical protein